VPAVGVFLGPAVALAGIMLHFTRVARGARARS
jgi:hypothetical protein